MLGNKSKDTNAENFLFNALIFKNNYSIDPQCYIIVYLQSFGN